jgi:hypothetical protein
MINDSSRIKNNWAAWSAVILKSGSSSNYYREQAPGIKKIALCLSSYSKGNITNYASGWSWLIIFVAILL